MATQKATESPPPEPVEVLEEPTEPAAQTRAEGEDPWEVPCAVCGLLGCRRHT